MKAALPYIHSQLAQRAKACALLLVAYAFMPPVALAADTSAEVDFCVNQNTAQVRRIEACTNVIANPPDRRTLFRAYINRAEAHFYMGRGDRAFPDYTQAILVEPENPAGYSIRGGARLAYNQYDGAISDFGVVLSQLPEDEYALNQRASAYHRSNRLDLAIADYGVLLKLRPSKAEIYERRGSVYAAKKDWERARKDFDRAIELEPRYSHEFPVYCFKPDPVYPFVKRDRLINWPDCER